VALTGGLIGDRIYKESYQGTFGNTPIFIGTGHPDPHVPVERVYETRALLHEMNAAVTLEVYPHIGHTVVREEIDKANLLVFV
jgi:phospholipase/carboxylesterase